VQNPLGLWPFYVGSLLRCWGDEDLSGQKGPDGDIGRTRTPAFSDVRGLKRGFLNSLGAQA